MPFSSNLPGILKALLMLMDGMNLSLMLSALFFKSKLGLCPTPIVVSSVRRVSRFFRAWVQSNFSMTFTQRFLAWDDTAWNVQLSPVRFLNHTSNFSPLVPTFSVRPKSAVWKYTKSVWLCDDVLQKNLGVEIYYSVLVSICCNKILSNKYYAK